MSGLTDSGIEYATPDDGFDPTGLALAQSLEGRTFVPVTNVTHRTQVAAAFGPTATKPLLVRRADAPSYAKYEETVDGTTWAALIMGDTGWVAAGKPAGYDTHSTLETCRVGPIAHAEGLIRPNSGSFPAAGLYTDVLIVAAGHRPPSGRQVRLTGARWNASGTPEYRGDISVLITSDGNVDVYVPAATTGVYLDGQSYRCF